MQAPEVGPAGPIFVSSGRLTPPYLRSWSKRCLNSTCNRVDESGKLDRTGPSCHPVFLICGTDNHRYIRVATIRPCRFEKHCVGRGTCRATQEEEVATHRMVYAVTANSEEQPRQSLRLLPAGSVERAPISWSSAVNQIGRMKCRIKRGREDVVFKRDADSIICAVLCDDEVEWIEVSQVKYLTSDLLVLEVRHGRSVAIFHDSQLGLSLLSRLGLLLGRLRFTLLDLFLGKGHYLFD